MTIFDYVVLFILISSVVISTMRGLVKEILSLVGWVAAFIVANAFGAKLAPMLPSVIPGEALRLIVAFIALFLGVRVLMGLLALAISALIEASGLSLADRGLGGLFGLGRGIVIVLAGVIHPPTGFLERRAVLAHGGNRSAHSQTFLARCLRAARAVLKHPFV